MSGEDKAAKSCRHADTMDPTEDAFRQDSEEPGEFDAMIKQYKDMASGHQARRGSLRVEGVMLKVMTSRTKSASVRPRVQLGRRRDADAATPDETQSRRSKESLAAPRLRSLTSGRVRTRPTPKWTVKSTWTSARSPEFELRQHPEYWVRRRASPSGAGRGPAASADAEPDDLFAKIDRRTASTPSS